VLCVALSSNTEFWSHPVVLCTVNLSTGCLLVSAVAFGHIFLLLMLLNAHHCYWVSAEVFAEAHSAVLLVLPLSCWLVCPASQNFVVKPRLPPPHPATHPAALRPVLSARPLDLLPLSPTRIPLFVLRIDLVCCHTFHRHVRRNFYVSVHIWSGRYIWCAVSAGKIKSCLLQLRQKYVASCITLVLFFIVWLIAMLPSVSCQ